MAENKKSFIAYADAEAGKLAKHLFRYVNDLNPEAPDKLTKMCFIPIKQALKRDLNRYESIIERNKINGSKGGRPKNPKEPKKPSGLFRNPKKPKKADNDNDNDNKDIYTNFYKTEFEKSNNDPTYKKFINWLYRENIYGRELKHVLKMEEQVSWKQFPQIKSIQNEYSVSIKEMLEEMENWLMGNPKAKNKTVIGTLRTFAKNRAKK
jgi:hypothetical protein